MHIIAKTKSLQMGNPKSSPDAVEYAAIVQEAAGATAYGGDIPVLVLPVVWKDSRRRPGAEPAHDVCFKYSKSGPRDIGEGTPTMTTSEILTAMR